MKNTRIIFLGLFLFVLFIIELPVSVEGREFDAKLWEDEASLHYTGWGAWNRKWNLSDAPRSPGTATIIADKTPVCGEKIDFSFVFTPHETIDVGGALAIGMQMIWNSGHHQGSIQADKASQPGHVTFECSNAKTSLEVHTIRQTFETNIIEVFVRENAVKPGDTITISVQDFSVGGWDLHQLYFVLAVDAKGNTQYKRIKELPFLSTHPASPARILVVGPSSTKKSGYFDLAVTALDRFGNRVDDYRGTVTFESSIPCKNLPRQYTFTGKDEGNHTFTNLRVGETSFFTITV